MAIMIWSTAAIFSDFLAFPFLSWENQVFGNEDVDKSTVLRGILPSCKSRQFSYIFLMLQSVAA